MGYGTWSTGVYDAASRYRAGRGESAFAYSDNGATEVHPDLDPYGVRVRESRDSAEHPASLAVAVLFDVTGSMRSVPRALQAKLPRLLGLLQSRGYARDPQIMFGGIGDATCDRAPLQIGQFESDNRMDDDLSKIYLEGGGGGQLVESYELAMHFMARHTSIDCFEKRGKRGYLFMIGDEMAYPRVKAHEVRRVMGWDIGQTLSVREAMAEVQRMYDVYFIIPEGAFHHGNRKVIRFWRELLGQNVLYLEDLGAVCETIALTIGLAEKTINLWEGLGHLAEMGSTSGASVRKALSAGGDPCSTQ